MAYVTNSALQVQLNRIEALLKELATEPPAPVPPPPPASQPTLPTVLPVAWPR